MNDAQSVADNCIKDMLAAEDGKLIPGQPKDRWLGKPYPLERIDRAAPVPKTQPSSCYAGPTVLKMYRDLDWQCAKEAFVAALKGKLKNDVMVDRIPQAGYAAVHLWRTFTMTVSLWRLRRRIKREAKQNEGRPTQY